MEAREREVARPGRAWSPVSVSVDEKGLGHAGLVPVCNSAVACHSQR